MIRSAKTLCLGVLTFLAVAAPVRAQDTASEHFPSGAPAVGVTTMKLSVKAKNAPQVQTGDFALAAGATGPAVAVAAINEICAAAVGAGFSCSGSIPAPCAGIACCGAAAGAGAQLYDCTLAGHGFEVSRVFTEFKFKIIPLSDDEDVKIQSLNCVTTAVHGSDLLDRVLVRLDPNGVNGTATFSVHHTQGGTNPRTFTINTTGLSDDVLHDAIAAGYSAMGLGISGCRRPSSSAASSSFDPGTFPGAFVEVTYTAATKGTLTDFEVDGAQSGSVRQRVTMETAGSPDAIPTLSEWAIVALVGTLLLTGVWMIRRARRLRPA